MKIGDQKKQWESDLIQAVMRDDLPEVETLLADKKGDINAYDENGWTALYSAIKAGASIIIFIKLLKAGAEPNIPTNEVIFRYPIHAAIENGSVEMLDLLVRYHADIHAKDGMGNTPLSLAATLGQQDCINFLLNIPSKDKKKVVKK
jgi:uncharacterized protein